MDAKRQDWDAAQYLRFENERTRPSIDLLARVFATAPARCIDLGCGPGNSTELVAARFPDAAVEGLDSSPDMLAKARARLPQLRFARGDVATFEPGPVYDLVFANAVLQWLPDHAALMPRLARALAPGGCLAVQMPDNFEEPSHRLMREVAQDQAWRETLRAAGEDKAEIGDFGDYRTWLQGAGCSVDIWRTTYVHALPGPAAIVEWFKSTGLRPYIDRLDAAARAAFLLRYQDEIARAYPVQPDGSVLLEFPRLFIVATRG